jgi:acetolactate synthase-1/2/3 large subunit
MPSTEVATPSPEVGPSPEVRPSPVTVAHRVLRACRDHGVRTAFGVHGANIEDVYAAAPDVPITAIVAKHEFAAGAMADGLARMSIAPGLVMTTSGAGAMNVLPALAESYDSRVPVLALIGSPPTGLAGRGAFQDMLAPPDTIDLLGMLMAVTGFCTVLDRVDDLDETLSLVFETLDRGYPAALVIPKDVQALPVPTDPGDTGVTCADVSDAADDVRAADDAAAIAGMTDLLIAARHRGAAICLWIGDEASRVRAGAVIDRLAGRLDATVVAAPGGMDVLGSSAIAGVTGVMGHPSAHRAVSTSDLTVAIGCRMTATDRAGLDGSLDRIEVAHIGTQAVRYRPCTSVLVTDLSAALASIDDKLEAEGFPVRARPRIRRELLATPTPHTAPRTPAYLSLATIVDAIGARLPADSRVFIDAGNVGAAAVHHLQPAAGQRMTVALGMGGMGYAIAAGVGVAVGDPDGGRVVVIAGDGAFFMHGMEFHTAVQHGAPLTLVVLNNNAYGMCVTREHLFFPHTASVTRFGETDIAAGLAAMFPEPQVRHPATARQIRADCGELFDGAGPNCIVVDCDPDEIPPFLPFL